MEHVYIGYIKFFGVKVNPGIATQRLVMSCFTVV